MEGERNTTTQYRQSGESQELPPADQVEVKERGLLDTLLGRKKAPAEDQEKQEEALVSAMENVNVSEPETKHEGGGEKKESLLAKLHRTGSSSSSSSDEEEEVIDDNGEVVKRKKKGLKEKLPGGHKKPEDTTAATAPATHVDDVQSSPDGKDKEKKQGLLGRIMDKVPGYNKTPAEDHIESAATAGEHKTTSSS